MNGDKLTELKHFLKDVFEQTGAEVRLAPNGGDETVFSLVFGGEEVPAYLSGTGEEAQRTVKLISYLVSKTGEKQLFPEKKEHLKGILLGEGSEWNAFRFMTKYNLSADACFALDVLPERRLDEAVTHVERCLADTNDFVLKMDDTRLAVVKFCDEGQSPVEFGEFLAQSIYEELGVKASVGVGCVEQSFAEISSSYAQAVTAVRMSEIFRSKGEVHSYREYLLVRMLEDVPPAKLKDYTEQFRIGGMAELFSDEDMMGTAEAFLENSLNVSETSRNLYMHRNTLMYRLDKIERITGLNIRKFSDAVTFRVISILYKLLKL